MILSSHANAKQTVEILNTIVRNLIEFFESHRLNINTDKTEFIIFCKSNNTPKIHNTKISAKDQQINVSKSTEFSGIFIRQNLTYEDGLKNI